MLLAQAPNQAAVALASTPAARSSKHSAEIRAQEDRNGIEYFVWVFAKAASQVRTGDELVNLFLPNAPAEDRKFIAKQISSIPKIYRSGPTSIAVENEAGKYTLDFRDVARARIYISGQSMVLNLRRSIRSQWPVWERKFDLIAQGSRGQSASRLDYLDLFSAQAEAQEVAAAGEGLTLLTKALTRVEEAALRAERAEADIAKGAAATEKLTDHITAMNERIRLIELQNAELKAQIEAQRIAQESTQTELAETKKQVDNLLAKKKYGALKATGITVGTAVLTGLGIGLPPIGYGWLYAHFCIGKETENTECATRALAMKAAKTELSSTPQLTSPSTDVLRMTSDKFAVGAIPCAHKSTDPVDVPVTMKSGANTQNEKKDDLRITIQYSDPPATSSTTKDLPVSQMVKAYIVDPDADPHADKPRHQVDFTLVDGHLTKICLLKTKAEIEEYTNQHKGVPGPDTRCIDDPAALDSGTEVDKSRSAGTFDYYSLLLLLIDYQYSIQCKARVIKDATTTAAPAAPIAPPPGSTTQQ